MIFPKKPLLLDLCCGGGGAARGYIQAGFDVIGIDTVDHASSYPGDFEKLDALVGLEKYGSMVDAVHTSPPCQKWTHGNVANNVDHHPDLISAHRAALNDLGLPYVIENVPRSPLIKPVVLCGTQFGLTAIDDDGTLLHLRRHRHFETNIELEPPRACFHPPRVQWAGAYGGARRDKHDARNVRHGGYVPPFHVIENLLGLWGMTENEMFQAIPPAYTKHIGAALMMSLEIAA